MIAITIKCHQCKRTLFEVTKETTGYIEIDCRRCGKRAKVNLPIGSQPVDPAQRESMMPNKTAVAAKP